MNSARLLVFLALAAAVAVLLYLLSPILTPFLLAALLAYVFNPVVARLVRWKLPRALAVVIVFLVGSAVLVALLLVLVPVVQRQIVAFVQKVPVYLDWIQATLVPRIEEWAGEALPVDFDEIRRAVIAHWQQIGNVARTALTQVTTSGMHVALWLVNLALIPVVTLYLLLDWDRILSALHHLFPPAARPTVLRLARETDEVLSSFLRGQLLVMFALAVLYSTGLFLVGLDLALPIGIVAGLLSFVPYLGFVIGWGSASIAAYLQFQEPVVLAWVFLVFFVAQLIESYVLTPRLVGRRIGLNPVAVIFAVMAGGQLFGFLGILLALPAAAALKVWLRDLHQNYIAPPAKLRSRRRMKAADDVP